MDKRQIDESALSQGEQRAERGDINLIEVFGVLWQGKWLIALCLTVAVLVSVLEVQRKGVVYHVESRLSPPHSINVAYTQLEILQLEPGDGRAVKSIKALYTASELFDQVERELGSRSAQRQFLLSQSVSKELTPGWFENKIRIERNGKGKGEQRILVVSMVCKDPDLCADLIDQYVAFVKKNGRDGLVAELMALLDSEEHKARQKAEYLKRVHRQSISDRIERLNAQIDIAKGLGWVDPQVGIVSSDKVVSRYYEGYKLLKMEREGLKAQYDNESFVVGLRQQQQKLARIELERQRIDSYRNEISVANVVDMAYASGRPSGPNMKLVLIVAVVLGSLVGGFLVLVRHGYKAYKSSPYE